MKCLFSLLLFCVFAVAPVLPSGAMKREVRGGWIYETWEVSDGLPTSSILDIIEGKDGYLWIATFDGLVRFDGQRFFTFDVTNTPGLKSNRILALGFDKSGSLWFRVGLYNAGTIRGGILQTRPGGDDEGNAVLRSIDSRPRHANIPSRLMPAGDLRRSIRDSHGNFWLAMVSGGLVRLSRARVDTVHPEFQVHAVVVDVRGRIWLQSRDRALCVMERIDAPCVELLLPSGKGPALTLGRGEKGEVFAADAASVYRVDGDKPMKMGSVPPGYIPTAVTTLGGELWLGTVKGLFRVTRERTKKVVYHEEMANAIIIELMRDSQGRMWIGTYGKGIFRVTGNRVDRFFDGHGLGGDFIQFVIEDSGGWFWVGTKKGLTVLVNDHPVIIRKNQGLYDNSVFTFLPDGLGNVWISSNKGIFRTPLNELRAFVRGEKLKIVSLHFDESDGMLSRECNGISRLAGARGPAGRLLFACLRGLTAINPAKLSPAGTVPRVALDGVSVDARPLSPTGTISLEPGDRRVTFRFGAIALFGHEKIRYRYRLSGYDRDWQETSGRSVTYTNLPAGSYRFMVKASSRDGVWGEAVTSLPLSKPPYFSERTSVRLAAAGLIVLLTALLFWFVLRRQKRRHRELTAINEKLQSLDRMKDQFLASTSHELRTPLHGILAMTEVHLRELDGIKPGDARACLSTVKHSAGRLLNLINDILDFQRMSTVGSPGVLPRGRTMVAAVVNMVVEQLSLIYSEKQLACRVRVDSLCVAVSEERLEQILFNLVGNAFRYTLEGSVEISATGDGEMVTIVVSDTGPGIPAEQRERIFEPFYQGSNIGVSQGTGLGLTVCRQIIEAYGGSIALNHEIEHGTSMVVSLPQCAHDQQEECINPGNDTQTTPLEVELLSPSLPACPGDGESEARIVCVDDDPVNLQVVKRLLGDSPYTVECFPDGEQALGSILETPPDLLLLDLLMPRMDGITLCKEVRKVHGPGSLPILFLTALSETGQVEAGFLAGGNDYITKPFSRESLLARVGFHLDTVRNCCAREELLLARVEETRALIEEYEAKYGERRLDEEQAQVLLDAVRRLMEEERIWQDPLLSMKRVARKLQMKQADLSQVLNDRLGQNFHSFVNGYRVSHVCDRLRDRADCGVTILEIAFDAGFSSKSAFHVQFKQVTGMTPSEFRKKHAKL